MLEQDLTLGLSNTAIMVCNSRTRNLMQGELRNLIEIIYANHERIRATED